MSHATLIFDEPVRLDPEQLRTLVRRLGAANADRVVSRAMDELAARLAELPALHRSARTDDLAKRARSLIAIADQIGLASFSRVAADVRICARRRDWIALAATLARLQRIADRSLTAIWEMQGMRL